MPSRKLHAHRREYAQDQNLRRQQHRIRQQARLPVIQRRKKGSDTRDNKELAQYAEHKQREQNPQQRRARHGHIIGAPRGTRSVKAGYNVRSCPEEISTAEVAELADALASGASGRKLIGVQIPASAPDFARKARERASSGQATRELTIREVCPAVAAPPRRRTRRVALNRSSQLTPSGTRAGAGAESAG